MLLSTKEDDIVLDCFAGSGTTGLVAKKHNRKYVMIEKDKSYYNLINERLK
jgi:site-specific DNA-methyltransferase (adenine-specific)